MAYTNYSHDAITHAELGTVFDNNHVECRAELDHSLSRNLRGAVGLHLNRRDLGLSGPTRFMPDSLTNRFTVFLLERVDLGNFSLESGLRYERANLTADGGRTERNFNAVP